MSRDLNIAKSQPWRRLYFVSLTARSQTFSHPDQFLSFFPDGSRPSHTPHFQISLFGGIFSPLIFIAFKAPGRHFGEIIRGKKISKPQLKCNAELFWRAGIISPSSSHRRVCSELASRATAVCLLSCLFVEKHLCSHSLIDKWVLPYVKSDLIQMPFLIGMLTTQDISKQ